MDNNIAIYRPEDDTELPLMSERDMDAAFAAVCEVENALGKVRQCTAAIARGELPTAAACLSNAILDLLRAQQSLAR